MQIGGNVRSVLCAQPVFRRQAIRSVKAHVRPSASSVHASPASTSSGKCERSNLGESRMALGRRIHPVCCLMTVLFVVHAAEAQNDQPALTTPKKQSEEIPVTSFSCKGRVPGYYADLDTGCQVYHMCAAGGQKFSYRCPEHTLFQQRMMVCDHWFMVDCKNSHLYYAANERIGDKNQPFISSSESVPHEFIGDTFHPVKLETKVHGKAIEFNPRFNSFTTSKTHEPAKDLLPPPFENSAQLTERADFGSSEDSSTLPSTINRELTPVTRAPTFPVPSTKFTFSPLKQQTSSPSTASSFQTRTTPPIPLSAFLTQNFTKSPIRPMGLSQTTLSVIKSSFFGNFPQPVSRTTQSFIPSTTPSPRTTVFNDVLSPSTINSLLRSPEKKRKEPKQLRVMLDTRRMFFIPENEESIPPEQQQQDLEFVFPDFQFYPKPMRFKEHLQEESERGNCPPQCFPAFFKPGTCEPCSWNYIKMEKSASPPENEQEIYRKISTMVMEHNELLDQMKFKQEMIYTLETELSGMQRLRTLDIMSNDEYLCGNCKEIKDPEKRQLWSLNKIFSRVLYKKPKDMVYLSRIFHYLETLVMKGDLTPIMRENGDEKCQYCEQILRGEAFNKLFELCILAELKDWQESAPFQECVAYVMNVIEGTDQAAAAAAPAKAKRDEVDNIGVEPLVEKKRVSLVGDEMTLLEKENSDQKLEVKKLQEEVNKLKSKLERKDSGRGKKQAGTTVAYGHLAASPDQQKDAKVTYTVNEHLRLTMFAAAPHEDPNIVIRKWEYELKKCGVPRCDWVLFVTKSLKDTAMQWWELQGFSEDIAWEEFVERFQRAFGRKELRRWLSYAGNLCFSQANEAVGPYVMRRYQIVLRAVNQNQSLALKLIEKHVNMKIGRYLNFHTYEDFFFSLVADQVMEFDSVKLMFSQVLTEIRNDGRYWHEYL
ncbi:Hypothetical predicted protein [Cloeon dipterum]|uniref:Chitin-binding type-2 domain-containing protein n=1 Tax=Cloeon dipterum TaxID=197152 RepID=A0A8S1C2N1_9INSE|nr:Hypothetical predicted protein [Cloeon dipterum]